MGQPPIVPGLPPEEPQYQPPMYPPQPVPVYQVQQRSDVVGKSVIGTITVVVTLVLILCILPMFLCVACGTLGNLTSG